MAAHIPGTEIPYVGLYYSQTEEGNSTTATPAALARPGQLLNGAITTTFPQTYCLLTTVFT